MIGYLVEQELGNRLPFEKPLASLLTMIEVDPADPAFARSDEADRSDLYEPKRPRSSPPSGAGCSSADGDAMRRVVPSPAPQRIFEHRPIRWLLDQGCVVICAGGGGIPTAYADGAS